MDHFKTTANSQSVKVFYTGDTVLKIETMYGTDITSAVASKDLTKISKQLERLRKSESVESVI